MKYPLPFDEKDIKLKAIQIRKDICEQTFEAGSGHPGGSLSATEIFTVLFNSILRHDTENPEWPNRDRFILSKAHITPGYYGTLCRAGYFDSCELKNFRKFGHFLQGHPKIDHAHGIEIGGGSLGQNLSIAVGEAIGLKKRAATTNPEMAACRVFDLSSEGELQEGSMWEAIMSAAHYRLNNLCIMIDYNRLQIDGSCADVMEVDPLDKKFEAFNWNVIVVDGHDVVQLYDAFKKFEDLAAGKIPEHTERPGTTASLSDLMPLDPTRPTAIICKTEKGHGISFMANVCGWHGKAPNKEEFDKAIAELDAVETELKKPQTYAS